MGADEFTTNAAPRISLRLNGIHSLVSFATFLGVGYDLERANDLSGASWSLVATNIPGTGGVLQLSDASAANEEKQFYRVRLAP